MDSWVREQECAGVMAVAGWISPIGDKYHSGAMSSLPRGGSSLLFLGNKDCACVNVSREKCVCTLDW